MSQKIALDALRLARSVLVAEEGGDTIESYGHVGALLNANKNAIIRALGGSSSKWSIYGKRKGSLDIDIPYPEGRRELDCLFEWSFSGRSLRTKIYIEETEELRFDYPESGDLKGYLRALQKNYAKALELYEEAVVDAFHSREYS
jgi:hypothetical protein